MKFKLINPTISEIRDRYDEIIKDSYSKGNYEDKVIVRFSEPVEVIKRRKRVQDTEFEMKFFDSVQGSFCYSFNKRTGMPLPSYIADKIVYMATKEVKKPEDTKEKQIKSILNSKHENVWNYDDFEDMLRRSYSSLNKRSLTSILPKYVIEEIKSAMDNKKDYRWSQSGKKRDYSIQVKYEDGVGRAWFSSEYSGCGNGDYYILINPTTATLKETD